jgi:hypothetical protein
MEQPRGSWQREAMRNKVHSAIVGTDRRKNHKCTWLVPELALEAVAIVGYSDQKRPLCPPGCIEPADNGFKIVASRELLCISSDK